MLQFARLYPLGQRDLPIERKQVDFGPLMPRNTHIENPSRDYTPPSALPAPVFPVLCGPHCTGSDALSSLLAFLHQGSHVHAIAWRFIAGKRR